MKLGAIDIGTNSTRLIIAHLAKPGKLKSLRREAVVTRLGEGVNETSCLKKPAILRTLKVLTDYKSILDAAVVDDVIVAATSAVRDAKNSEDFLCEVEQLFGIKVKILSGEEEAQLSFLGATYDLSPQLILVLDIGGGSTELIFGKPSKILEIFSLDIGCVRLTEMFLKSDPPTIMEIDAAKRYVREILTPAVTKIRDPDSWSQESQVYLIGVAGTITTISAINQRMETYDSNRIHNSKLTYSDMSKLQETFLSMHLSKRKKIVGLEPKRADVIIAGTLIALQVLEAFNLQEIIVTEHDILDGLILSLAHFKTVF
jgi:exopolyphosphatase/guanosine-5'-triphosphate,3'-diphosphate pyrophosphatase